MQSCQDPGLCSFCAKHIRRKDLTKLIVSCFVVIQFAMKASIYLLRALDPTERSIFLVFLYNDYLANRRDKILVQSNDSFLGCYYTLNVASRKCYTGAILMLFWSTNSYRKIPKIRPGAYIFQWPLLRGLFLEGLIYGGKFAFTNRLGQPYSSK